MSKAHSIVVLTGAGISAESGLSTFRGAGGIWEKHRVEEVASPEAFRNEPRLVHRFYNERRQRLLSPRIVPNAAHTALADFEKDYDGEFLLITQNIDHLHERAGSVNLLHMHGELLKKRCAFCDHVSEALQDLSTEDTCADCSRPGGLRPHVVWFGEMPLHMDRIHRALSTCDLFVSIGTSGNVYPAAGFVDIVNERGGESVEMNLEPSAVQSSFGQRIYGPAGTTLPPYLARILR